MGNWQWSMLPQVVRVDYRRRRTGSHHHAMVYGVVYIFIHPQPKRLLMSYCITLDAAPARQQCPTKVEHCSAIGIMCVVWVAAWYQSYACWYSIHDDFASKYIKGVYWIVVRCEDHTGYSTVLQNCKDIPARLESCVMCMHLCKIIRNGWCCGWLPIRWWCVSPWLWQRLYLRSFLMGTTASECGTAWRQCHNVHIVILVVVLFTMKKRHALVKRLKLTRSYLL